MAGGVGWGAGGLPATEYPRIVDVATKPMCSSLGRGIRGCQASCDSCGVPAGWVVYIESCNSMTAVLSCYRDRLVQKWWHRGRFQRTHHPSKPTDVSSAYLGSRTTEIRPTGFRHRSGRFHLRVPPGNRLEPLTGDRNGQHSIRINQRYRICFAWTDSGPANVEIADYH